MDRAGGRIAAISAIALCRSARVFAADTQPSSVTAPAKLSFRERQEVEGLPARIEAIESRIASLQQQLADPALYQRDPEQARTAAHDLRSAEDELAKAYARWEALEDKR